MSNRRRGVRPARNQPSLVGIPPPELKALKTPRPTGDHASTRSKTPPPSRPATDLFIVDNSDADWKVAQYLYDWCEIARALDVATGYFEIGGLLLLDGQWQKLERIRILMGDEVTKKTKQAFEQALNQIAGTLDSSLEREKEKNDFLRGVPAIVAALRSGQIACRVYRERKFHAKAYITHAKFEVMGATALVGSSNFTYPGLHDNIELNVRLRSEVEGLQAWYEHYWDEAEDVTPDLLRVIEKHVREYTPFDVYAKALYEYQRGHSPSASEWERTQSRTYNVLDYYQKEGYHALLRRTARYNGALLCDSVGLGKTFIGLMLIERLVQFERKRVALIVPKAARRPVWESKLNKYLPGLAGSTFGSNLAIFNHTDLTRGGDYVRYMQEIQEQADVVIIDEAHHFRNQASQRYRRLFDMLAGKQVYLLTATPVNNSLLDLQHEIELFSRRRADYFKDAPLGIHSLAGHFRTLENALKKIVGERDGMVDVSMAEAEKVLAQDDLFRALVVQRSRAYAKRSQEQHSGHQVIFPLRERPQVAKYSLKETYGDLLEHLEQAFMKEKPLLSLAVYYPLAFYKGPDGSIDPLQEGRQAQVVGLIRTQLLKRFESAARAFEATCERLLLKLLAFIEVNTYSEAEQRRLGRWKAQHSETLERVREHIGSGDEDEDEDDQVPSEFLEAADQLDPTEYRIDEIIAETYLDLDQLLVFLDDLKGFSPQRDDKLQSLLALLHKKPLDRQKVLIFSEYMETAHYLYEQLKAAGIGPVDEVHGQSTRDRGEIIQAFSPYYNDTSSAELNAKGITETRVLISTDVLSEGLNLQDATLLINYDLHWNPVRLMQRIGRVDRRLDPEVETRMVADNPESKEVRGRVRFWNFLPPDELNDLLGLYETVAHKTLRISKIFGIEGKQLLRPEDDYQALKEFSEAYEGTPSPAEMLRLTYRDLVQANPGLEDELARFPLRVFSGRAHPSSGAQGVFFCYSLPAKNAATGEWDPEAAFARWYYYDAQSGKIAESAEEIHPLIASTRETPRRCVMAPETLVEIRKKIEKHITNSYLKSIVAPVGVKPVLKAWMELN